MMNNLLLGGMLLGGAAAADRPNILFFLADDFGWANTQIHVDTSTPEGKQHSQEVQTSNMDKLTAEGIEIDRHYTYKFCGPSRNSLQSGRMPINIAVENFGILVNNPEDPVSGQGGLPVNMTGIASKLKSSGYQTGMSGKWDVGMVTPEQTPMGKGYDDFLGYFSHANNFWTKKVDLTSAGEIDACLSDVFIDFHESNATYVGPVGDRTYYEDQCEFSDEEMPPCYAETAMLDRAMTWFDNFDPAQGPFFYFYSFHLVHSPLQVPKAYIKKIEELVDTPFDIASRKSLAAMVMFMDDVIGKVVDKLKEINAYDDTLIVFTSDNGGALYMAGGGNNFPLRGGKYSEFEGGVRTNTFISGGFIPEANRGQKYEGLMHIADWYGMFCDIAGISKTDEQALAINPWLTEHNLPTLAPVDSVDGLWQSILANDDTASGPRQELHLSLDALIQWPYKVVRGDVVYNTNGAELYPSCSSVSDEVTLADTMPWFVDAKFLGLNADIFGDHELEKEKTFVFSCGDGCLFNIETDPTEMTDLAKDMPDQLKKMQETLIELNKGLFDPERGEDDEKACTYYHESELFAYGPWINADDYYTDNVRKVTAAESAFYDVMQADIELVHSGDNSARLYKTYQAIMPMLVPMTMTKVDACLVDQPDFYADAVSQSKDLMPVIFLLSGVKTVKEVLEPFFGKLPEPYCEDEGGKVCIEACAPCLSSKAGVMATVMNLAGGAMPLCPECTKACLAYLPCHPAFSAFQAEPAPTEAEAEGAAESSTSKAVPFLSALLAMVFAVAWLQ
jgi:arylsulfatase B